MLKSSSPPTIVKYVDSNWHHIHEEWIMGLKWSCANFMNSTNNRAESINAKLNSIVDRYSSLKKIVRKYFSCALNSKRGHVQSSNHAPGKGVRYPAVMKHMCFTVGF